MMSCAVQCLLFELVKTDSMAATIRHIIIHDLRPDLGGGGSMSLYYLPSVLIIWYHRGIVQLTSRYIITGSHGI